MLGKELRTAAAFQGGGSASICVKYNINGNCDGKHRSGDSSVVRVHACAWCGKPHPALSRDPTCARVWNGAITP
ncbi:hypothetical protein B0H12DRAFT_1118067 [Mycena haematopus]|nr:hypothetical protein B0H12DRAFT_1118067 [Mycena haematopus]